jgi:hypothetical protein
VWPAKPSDLPDEDPTFLVGYLSLEFAGETKAEQDRIALELFAKYGDKPRRYKNGVALAVPDKKQIEALRRAVRYLLAADRIDSKKQQLRLTKDQLDQLRERRRTEEAAIESSFRTLYAAVWLPRMEDGKLGLEKIDVGGRPLQATGVHQRVMELLTSVGTPRVHGVVTPRKLVERVKLGEPLGPGEPPRLGLRAAQVRDAFFENLESPRLESASALRKAISRGVAEEMMAYTSGTPPALGPDGKFLVSREKVVLGRQLNEDEIDLDSGFVMVPSAVQGTLQTPSALGGPGLAPGSGMVPTPGPIPPPATSVSGMRKAIRLAFRATRDQVFRAFPAIANLADRSDGGKVTIQVEATSETGYDPAWLRNAVEEPLDEADVERRNLIAPEETR